MKSVLVSLLGLSLACSAGPGRGDAGPTCGVCPTGYTCGSANGIPVCRSAAGIPVFQHVFVIVMENTSWTTLENSNNTPYLHDLMTTAAYSTNYHGVTHPSLPNYIALTSGDTQGVGCDCNPTGTTSCGGLNCNLLVGSCDCPQTAKNIADDIEAASGTWHAYGEDMGTPCNTTTSGNYAARHVPFLYYAGIQTNSTRCTSNVVDFSQFQTDLLVSPVQFAYIAPNLVDDMHNPYPATSTNLANGDAWIAIQAQVILSSNAYKNGGLLVIVWDEDDNNGIPNPDDPVPLFMLSPLARQFGYVSTTHVDHYSLLATLEDGLGLPRLGNAATAQPLTDFFAN